MKSKIILLAVGLSLTAACNSNNTDDTKFIKSVITVTPQSLNHQTDKTFSGIVRENREISAGFKTPGQIINVYANEGDFVKQGQLLAVLDDKDYKLGLQAAEIQYNQLNDEVARLKKLFEKQSISGNDYEKAVAGLKQLEIQLQSNKNKLEYTKLYSPCRFSRFWTLKTWKWKSIFRQHFTTISKIFQRCFAPQISTTANVI